MGNRIWTFILTTVLFFPLQALGSGNNVGAVAGAAVGLALRGQSMALEHGLRAVPPGPDGPNDIMVENSAQNVSSCDIVGQYTLSRAEVRTGGQVILSSDSIPVTGRMLVERDYMFQYMNINGMPVTAFARYSLSGNVLYMDNVLVPKQNQATLVMEGETLTTTLVFQDTGEVEIDTWVREASTCCSGGAVAPQGCTADQLAGDEYAAIVNEGMGRCEAVYDPVRQVLHVPCLGQYWIDLTLDSLEPVASFVFSGYGENGY